MLYFLLIFAVLFILAQAWLLYKFVNRITELSEQRDKALQDYEALDKGMVELSDAYETDCLQYEDTVEKLNEEKRTLRGQYTDLSVKYARVCENNATLLHNAQIDRTARHEMARQLDIAQTIISEHDLNCLPHIVLSSMENHKDTPLPTLSSPTGIFDGN